jgi:hypothetical protein
MAADTGNANRTPPNNGTRQRGVWCGKVAWRGWHVRVDVEMVTSRDWTARTAYASSLHYYKLARDKGM